LSGVAKKTGKKVGLGNLAFSRIDPYGEAAAAAANPEPDAFQDLHLDSIRPDPNQPRQQLPAALRQQFHQGELPPSEVMRQWEASTVTANASAAEQQTITAIRQLADSIARHGLINPITVQETASGQYLIVTGERRWWAHVWLTLHNRPIVEGDQELAPDRIRARLVAKGITIRAHQLIENLIREDLNVLERAQGIVALREEMENVARGQQKEAKVRWQDVEAALSISRSYRIRTMKVLALSPQAQAIIAKHNLTERAIRPIAEKLADYPNLQIEALQQLVAWRAADSDNQQTLVATEQLVEQLLRSTAPDASTASATTASPTPERQAQTLRQKVRQTLRFVRKLESLAEADKQTLHMMLSQEEAFADVRGDLQALRQALDRLLS
jgi:ParB/RepB/Spo0J family partition protein